MLRFFRPDPEQVAPVREITADLLNSRLSAAESLYLVDVRENHEWNRGRIPGARHLPLGRLEREIGTLIPDKNSEVVVYCEHGVRSAFAAGVLQRLGYSSVLSLELGFNEWRSRGFPADS